MHRLRGRPDLPDPAPLQAVTARPPKFRRAGEERRRQDLIDATLDCVAEHGLQGATVRAIAVRAGVSGGLIRHYFPNKDQLLEAAYDAVMQRMTEEAKAALARVEDDPRRRLAAFVVASLTPPGIDARSFSLWASFIGRATAHPSLATAHRLGTLGFRHALEELVDELLRAAGRAPDLSQLRRHAIAINAVIDGLWVEGCLAGDLFKDDEVTDIGIASVERLIGIRLRPVAPREVELT